MTVPSPQYQAPPRKPSLAQRGKERTASRAHAVIAPQLEPGEQVLVGTRVHTGPSDWWRLIPRIGEFVRLLQRHYFVVHTDRRVIFCGLSYWSGRPKNIKIIVPNGHARVDDYRPGKLHPFFRFSHPQRQKPMKVRANRIWRPEVERLVTGLGGGVNGQPGLAPPMGYQPQALGYQPQGPGYPPQAPGYPASGYPAPPQAPGHQPPGYPASGYQAPPPAPGYQPQAPQAPGRPRARHQAPSQQPQAPGYQPQAPGYPAQAPSQQPQAPGYRPSGYQAPPPAPGQQPPGYQAPPQYQPPPR
jgi:hypothetical protein